MTTLSKYKFPLKLDFWGYGLDTTKAESWDQANWLWREFRESNGGWKEEWFKKGSTEAWKLLVKFLVTRGVYVKTLPLAPGSSYAKLLYEVSMEEAPAEWTDEERKIYKEKFGVDTLRHTLPRQDIERNPTRTLPPEGIPIVRPTIEAREDP
ncbi:uncharacterized protein LY89DRAFT_744080 [Mollisia scopiformis]|uniref:Uncharacterized protein n=1 Tax=Mollisia scopiformis TaxID=149040 RepID=A0A132B1A6_MOLSC|nr:uncharacterized protein LY89DRAFT_744080 [Mollisia scopiformis]KUJ06155.1 hypothetical protein LY89DRAFT_744080 [Mollisia scopiformis]